MAGGAVTQVFVPRIFETPDARGVVIGQVKSEGDWVEAEEVFLEVRSRGVNGKILAPSAGKLVRLHVGDGDVVTAGSLVAELQAGEPGRKNLAPDREPARTVSPATAARAQIVATVAASAIALVWPMLALLVLAFAAGAKAIEKLAKGPIGRFGAAVSMFMGGVVRLFWFALLAVTAAGIVGGAAWGVTHGVAGLPAGARLAAFEWGPRLLAFAVAYRLVRPWLAAGPRAEQLRALADDLSAPAAAAGLAAVVAWLSVCALVLPRTTWFPAGSFESVAEGVLPDDAARSVRRLHADWVAAEARAVHRCLRDKAHGRWGRTKVSSPPGEPLVVSMYALGDTQASSVATLVLALQNQLEPHRVTLAIHPRERSLLLFDTLARVRPQTDIAQVLPTTADDVPGLTPGARQEAIDSVDESDVNVALKCSAAAW